jgi:hypothetical protein
MTAGASYEVPHYILKINVVCNWNDVLVIIKAISNWQLAEIKTLQNQRTSSLQFHSLKIIIDYVKNTFWWR